MSSRYLSEVAEAEATGAVAEVYADIRAVLGLPIVNLVYRQLAVRPSTLSEVWGRARTVLSDSDRVRAICEGVTPGHLGLRPWGDNVKELLGLGVGWSSRLRDTLLMYGFANSVNLSVVEWILGAGQRGRLPGGEGRNRRVPARQGGSRWDSVEADPLPMVRLEDVSAATRGVLEEIAGALSPEDGVVVVPSLFRHIAHRPAVLAASWCALGTVIDSTEFVERYSDVARAAQFASREFPALDLGGEDEAQFGALARFRELIPKMLVIGEALSEMI